MIPKIIHYCWFGEKPLPPLVQKCIKSWEEKCPGYEIKEWNEKNFDVNCNRYVEEAYKAKKYAFVSDYVRLYALHSEGGVYMDTDIEVLKNIDDFLRNNVFFGFETDNTIMTGIIGSEKNNTSIKELLIMYETRKFIQKNGSYDLTTNVEVITNYCIEKGLKNNNKIQEFNKIRVFPKEYFSPKDYYTGKITIKKQTYTIHHFDASWKDPKNKLKHKIIKLLGPSITEKLVKIKTSIKNIILISKREN